MSSSRRTFRRWRLRRAENALRDAAWRIQKWGFPGVYPSDKERSRNHYYRQIRRVHKLGGEPLCIDYVRDYHVADALPEAYERVRDGWEWVTVRV